MRIEDRFEQLTEGKYPYLKFKDATILKAEKRVRVSLSAPYEKCDELMKSGEDKLIERTIKDIFAAEGITYEVEVIFKKVYYNAEIIKHITEKFISEQYAAYCSQIAENAIETAVTDGTPIITLNLPDYLAGAFVGAEIPSSIEKHIFDLYGVKPQIKIVEYSGKAYDISSVPKLEAVTVKQYLHVTSEEMGLIGETIGEPAVYISRAPKKGDVCLAGTVSDLQDKISKKQYHYHTFKLSDTTGEVECIKFTRRKKGGVLGALENGNTVKVRGSFEDGEHSFGEPKFIVSELSLCKIDYSAVDDSEPKRTVCESVPIIPYNDSADNLEQILSESHPRISGRTYVALDFETTGKNPALCKVIEIGMARMTDGRVVEYFDTFVDPGIPIPADASRVNNIFDPDVKGAPDIRSVLPQMMKFIGDAPIIAHNGNGYDYLILARILKDEGMELKNELIDTLEMADELHVPGRHRLGDLCEYFHIPLLDAHRAYADCIATAKLFAALVRFADARKNR